MGCDQCVYERKIENMPVPGAMPGCSLTSCTALGSAQAERVITL